MYLCYIHSFLDVQSILYIAVIVLSVWFDLIKNKEPFTDNLIITSLYYTTAPKNS